MASEGRPRKKRLPALGSKRDPLRREATEAMRELTPQQRLAVEALVHTATRKLALARLNEAGLEIDWKTLDQWCRQPRMVRAMAARRAQLAALVSKDSVIVNAQNLMEIALEPKPILFKGEDTGHREVNVGAALTANEQLAKATGAFQTDQNGKTVVVINIDFSGRKNVVQETVLDGEYVEVDQVEPPESQSWLD